MNTYTTYSTFKRYSCFKFLKILYITLYMPTFEGYDSSFNQSTIVHKRPECTCTERGKEKDRDSKFFSCLYRKSHETVRNQAGNWGVETSSGRLVKSSKKFAKGLEAVLCDGVTKRGYVLTDITISISIQGRKPIWDAFKAKIWKALNSTRTP